MTNGNKKSTINHTGVSSSPPRIPAIFSTSGRPWWSGVSKTTTSSSSATGLLSFKLQWHTRLKSTVKSWYLRKRTNQFLIWKPARIKNIEKNHVPAKKEGGICPLVFYHSCNTSIWENCFHTLYPLQIKPVRLECPLNRTFEKGLSQTYPSCWIQEVT